MASQAIQNKTATAPTTEAANLDAALPRSRMSDGPEFRASRWTAIALMSLSWLALGGEKATAQEPAGASKPAVTAPANPGQTQGTETKAQEQDPVARVQARINQVNQEKAASSATRQEQAQVMREAANSAPTGQALRAYEPNRANVGQQQGGAQASGPATVYVTYNPAASQPAQAAAPQDPFAAYQARVAEQERLLQLRQREYGVQAGHHSIDQGQNQIAQAQAWQPVYNHQQELARQNTVDMANANRTATSNATGLYAFQSNVYTPVYYGVTAVSAAQTGLNAARVVSTFPGQVRDIGYMFGHWQGFFRGFR